MTTRTQFLVLTPADCRKVLARNRVGRLAFLNRGVVDIEPIGYVWNDDWLFFRSAYGAKLEALAHNPFAAFEVDEIRSGTSWASVVAHGTIYMLPADGAPIEQREFARALAALRKAAPGTLAPGDPTPQRDTVYGLHVDRLSGRAAQPARAPRSGRRAQPARTSPNQRRAPKGS
jgi:nitroimidazol reductase NimA-like FMN-containing flavoprotein (pyridoxamine 5'-phosphate oxidase superfamily)